MIVETFPVGLLQCNCTIVGDAASGEAIVIDPGDEPLRILEKLRAHGLTLKQIVCTHTHIDHVGAIHELQRQSGAKAAFHHADLVLYEHLDMQAQWLGIATPPAGHIDDYLQDGAAVECAGIQMGVLHTPGHTPGSTTFVLPQDGAILFTGDTLFSNGIGRTDLWGGSMPDILASIRKKLMTFDDDTRVVAGHGPATTIGRERRHNPFLR